MSKNDILLSSINQFYDNEKNRSTLLTILAKSGVVHHKLRKKEPHILPNW